VIYSIETLTEFYFRWIDWLDLSTNNGLMHVLDRVSLLLCWSPTCNKYWLRNR
jgi:hypothetical protein